MEEIRRLFNIRNDFTPEEEEHVCFTALHWLAVFLILSGDCRSSTKTNGVSRIREFCPVQINIMFD